MNGLTSHIRLEQPVMMWPIFAQLRRGAGDPSHRRVGDIHLRATYARRSGLDQDHCEWRSGVRPSMG